MDTSNVRHPSRRGVLIGDTSTHGPTTAGVETASSQNQNILVQKNRSTFALVKGLMFLSVAYFVNQLLLSKKSLDGLESDISE